MTRRHSGPIAIMLAISFLPIPWAFASPGAGADAPAADGAGTRAPLPADWTALEQGWSYTGGEFRSVQNVTDLNGDGYIDLVLLNRFDGTTHRTTSYIYWGSASGFSTSNRATLPTMGAHGVSWGDLDKDGYIDLVFSNLYDDSSYNIDSYIYWGSAGGFSTSSRTGLPTHAAVGASVADLNNDTWPDIVFSNWFDGSSHNIDSYIYWGSQNGFSSANRKGLPTMSAVASSIADLDNDGYADIVFSNQYDGSSWTPKSYIYWGSESGYSSADRSSLSTKAAYGNAVGDLNLDGYPDIVFSCEYDGSTYSTDSMVFWGSAAGFSDSNRALLPTRGAHECTVADLNADGWPDVVFSNFYTGTSHSVDLYIYWGSSSGFSTSSRQTLPATGCTGNLAEDLNGDGWLDIFASNFLADPGTYGIDSYLYWGSSSGFSSGNRQGIPGKGAIGAGAACGGVPTGEATFGCAPAAPAALAVNRTDVGANYTYICQVQFASNPGFRDPSGGPVFGYVDRENYFFCALEARTDALSLYKVAGGRCTRIARAAAGAVNQNVYYNVTLNVTGTQILVYLNGTLRIGTSDADLWAGWAGLRSAGGQVLFRPDMRPEGYLLVASVKTSPADVSENDGVTVNATLDNPGYGAVRGVPVDFRFGPDFFSAQPFANFSASVGPRSSASYRGVWTAAGGPQTLWVAIKDAPAHRLDIDVNRYPAVENVPNQRLFTETLFRLFVNGSDPDGDFLSWSVESDLALAVETAGNRTALVQITPVQEDVGRHAVVITATDAHGKNASQVANLTIERLNHPPVLGPPYGLVAYEKVPFCFTVNATDPDTGYGDRLRFSDDCPLFDLDPATGSVNITPVQSEVGMYLFNVTVADSGGLKASYPYTLEVRNTNDPPALNASPPLSLLEDRPFTFRFNATDPDKAVDPAEMLLFSDDSVLFDINPFTGEIAFTPRQKDVGSHSANITVTDRGGLSDRRLFTFVVVNVNDPPALAEIPPLTVEEDLPFTYNLTFSDEDWSAGLDSLAFSVNTSLVAVDQKGTLSVTATNEQVGQWAVTVTVTDSQGAGASRSFQLTVLNSNDPPSGVRIIFPQNGTRFPAGSRLILTGAGSDVDAGDELDFTWYDNDKPLGNGPELNVTLKPGTHRIRLEVADSAVTVRDEVLVIVNQPPAEPVSLGMVALFGALVLLAVLVAIGLFLILRKRKAGKT